MQQKPKIRLSLTRQEIVMLIESLECLIEDFQYWGGIHLIEDEVQLYDKIKETLRYFDKGPEIKVKLKNE